MKILLVEPEFPIPAKSKNHRDFLPIGLLKMASYYKEQGDDFKLVRGNIHDEKFVPDEIKITSLFTYWAKYVWESVSFYREKYPNAKITVGGIYASLMPGHCKKSGCDEVFIGIDENIETAKPNYDLVNVDYQIIHASRGCIRRCKLCGTWKIENKFTWKQTIKDEICSNRVIFYDNNLLANPCIENILTELKIAKYHGKPIYSECQCGLDGRLLNFKLAKMLKEAKFINPRIAWDGNYSDNEKIKGQIDTLIEAGYDAKNIYVFMIYNWNYPFKELENKRLKCWEWKVQIADCRYRPLNQTYDNYNPRVEQTINDYYIHPNWNDNEIKLFRRNVRRQNICVRHGFSFYSKTLEQKKFEKDLISSEDREKDLNNKVNDIWSPGENVSVREL